jgi:TRAP-type C4-dicarboxylate transport system substrate-binding protein
MMLEKKAPLKLHRVAWFFLLTYLLLLPGGHSIRAEVTKGPLVLKVATAAPRFGDAARGAAQSIKRLEERTSGRVTARVYWGGVAGDDKTVLRKMRIGQIDSAYMGLETMQYFVPQVMVLGAPNTFTTYKQVDAVREELTPQFDKIAYKNGFKILGWGDVGPMRIFSTKPIRKLSDFKALRPWLYEESPLLKEFYRMVGCSGIPVSLVDVYGALHSGLIETVWISPLIAVMFRWHSFIKYVSRPVGLIQGSFVLRRAFWDALDERDRQAFVLLAKEDKTTLQKYVRRYNDAIFQRMLKRGITEVAFDDMPEWLKSGKRLREMMVGRLYDRKILDRMEAIISRFPDDPKTPQGFR